MSCSTRIKVAQEMVRMGCLKPVFRLCCGCWVKKNVRVRGPGAAYTKVPTDEDFAFSPREDDDVEAGAGT